MSSPNKQAAVEFLELVASGRIRDAYRKHIADGFRHHNVYFRGDAESLMAAMEENEKKNPGKILTVQRAVEEGDVVAAHSAVQFGAGGQVVAVVHIFRFEAGKIAEMWDVGQPVPKDSPNENGAF